MVNAWEERLAGLEPPLQKVTPPATVWQRHRRAGSSSRRPAPLGRALAGASPPRCFWPCSAYFALRRAADSSRTQQAIDRRPIRRLSTGASSCSATTRSCSVQVQSPHALDAGKAHELWILPARGQPGVARPAAAPAASNVACSPPRSARRSPGPNNSRSVSSPRGARRPGFRPARCCTSRPCLQLEWPARFDTQINGVKPFSIRDLRAPAL